MKLNQLMKTDSTRESNMLTDGIMQTLKSKKLIDCSSKEIVEKLSMIYLLIGLRPQHFPTMVEDDMIIKFMKKHFANRRLDEFYLAFELAITGELDITDVKVYDQFTLEYLMRIMNSYKKWLIIKSRQIVDAQDIVEQPIPKLTEEDKIQEINEWRSKDSMNINFIPMYLYDWMYDFGYIDMDEHNKVELYSRAIKLRESELKNEADMFNVKLPYHNFIKMKENNFKEISKEEEVKIDNIFRKIAVFEYLKNK